MLAKASAVLKDEQSTVDAHVRVDAPHLHIRATPIPTSMFIFAAASLSSKVDPLHLLVMPILAWGNSAHRHDIWQGCDSDSTD